MEQSFILLKYPLFVHTQSCEKMEEPKCEKCGSRYGYIRRNKENLNLKEWYCRKCGHTTILGGEKND